MEDLIKGKVAAITGASSGIGEAIAYGLAVRGVKLVLGARRADKLKAIADRINAEGGEAVFCEVDVRNRKDLEALVDLAMARYGRLDVLVNNAGVAQVGRIDALDVEGWEEMIDVNLKGVLYGIAAAMPVFERQQSGHIINIISTSGIKIVPMQGVYAGTKNAVRTITEVLRQESKGWPRVTGISPGFVKSDLASGMKDPAMKEAMLKRAEAIAISPDAIARAVIYAIEQPSDVEVGDIVIRPAVQD